MSNLFNPRDLQSLCQKCHLLPSKKYGQNYLIDPVVIETIIEHSELSPHDIVAEVGPGFGVLTESLSPRVQKVFAFEIEKKLQSYWQERRKTLKNVEIIWGNVLYQSELLDSLKTYKVIANLPYQITSAVIRLFLEQKFPPLTMVVMVQKEVAERICAAPGDMSILSVAVQYYAKPEYITTVPRSAFWPSPAVDSAIIKLQPLSTPNIDTDKNQLFKLVKAGFSSRRKVLRKNLEGYVSKENKSRIVDALRQLNLSSEVRAQELGVTEWIALVRLLS